VASLVPTHNQEPIYATLLCVRSSRGAGRLLLAGVLAVLAATLPAQHGMDLPPWTICFVCGERGVADVLVNIILFLPFGAGCGLHGWSVRRGLLAGALLSAMVEFVQLVTPGRDPSLGDVLFNTTGAGLGFLLARTAPTWLLPCPRRAARLSLAAGAGVAASVLLTATLLLPALPRITYHARWTPNLGYGEWYRGRVLSVTLGDLAIPSKRLERSAEARRLLLADSGATLEVRLAAGAPVRVVAPIVQIVDGQRREIFMLGAHQDDLVLRYRTSASALRLDQPDIRLRGALAAVAPGDTVDLLARRERGGGGGRYCLGVRGAERCGLGFSAGSGWALLLHPEVLPKWLRRTLDAAWLGALFFPAGYWARRRWESALGVGVAFAALIAVPAERLLARPGAAELVGALGGIAAGLMIQAITRSHVAGHGSTPSGRAASAQRGTVCEGS
jgi:hypothetical protein